MFESHRTDTRIRSRPGVAEVERFGPEPMRLLVEVPHGATSRQELEALRRRLRGRELPPRLEEFFFVNTDVGAPECARAVARAVAGAGVGALVLRSLIPRTFVDCNRVLEAGNEDFLRAGVTQAIPDYVTDPEDLELLAGLHRDYQELADAAFGSICGAGGLGLILHSYAPRSVDIQRIGSDIVEALRRAYAPEAWDRWPERPEVDLLDRGPDDELLAAPALVEEVVARYAAIGIAAARSATYRLHPATAGYRHATRHPGKVLTVELRRDLLADPFDPFTAMTIGTAKVARLAAPLAACYSSALAPSVAVER